MIFKKYINMKFKNALMLGLIFNVFSVILTGETWKNLKQGYFELLLVRDLMALEERYNNLDPFITFLIRTLGISFLTSIIKLINDYFLKNKVVEEKIEKKFEELYNQNKTKSEIVEELYKFIFNGK
jgi:hypothetical protein